MFFILVLFCSTLFCDTYQLNKFGDLNTQKNKYLLAPRECTLKENVDTDEGGIKSRLGYDDDNTGYPHGQTEPSDADWVFKNSYGVKYVFKQIQSNLYASRDTVSWIRIKSGITYANTTLRGGASHDLFWWTNGADAVFYFTEFSTDSCTSLDFIPKGYDIEAHSSSQGNYIVIGGDNDNRSALYYSEPGISPITAEAWPAANVVICGDRDGQKINAIKSWRGNLYVFKDESIYKTSWSMPGIIGKTRISDYYGAKYKEGIKPYKDFLSISSNRGEILTNGYAFREIDDNIRDYIMDSNNMDGEYIYYTKTRTSEFDSFVTTTNVSLGYPGGINQIELQDRTTTWIGWDVALGTFTNAVVIDNYIRQKSTTVLDTYTLTIIPFNTYQIDDRVTRKFIDGAEWEYLNVFHNKDKLNDDNYSTSMKLDEPLVAGGYELKRQRDIKKSITGSITRNDPSNDIGVIEIKNIVFDEPKLINYIRLQGLFQDEPFENPTSGVVNVVAGTGLKYTIKVQNKNVINTFDTIVEYENTVSFNGVTGNPFSEPFDILRDTSSGGGFIGVTTDHIRILVEFNWNATFNESPPSNNKWYSCRLVAKPRILLSELEIKESDALPSAVMYSTSASVEHQIIDFGYDVAYSTFTVDLSTVPGVNIQFYVASSTNNTDWTGYAEVVNGQNMPVADGRYLSVISSFTASVSSYTAKLYDFTIGAKNSTGTYIDVIFSADKVNTWGLFDVKKDASGQTISTWIKFGETDTIVNAKPWVLVTTPYTITEPSTSTKVQVRLGFSTTDGMDNPLVENFTVSYAPESIPIPIVKAVVNDRLWIGYSTGSATTNSGIKVYDKNGHWGDYLNMKFNTIFEFGEHYYASDAVTANLWQLEYGRDDNGSVIMSKYNFPPLDFGSPEIDKHIDFVHYSCVGGTGTFNLGIKLANASSVTQSTDQTGRGRINGRIPFTSGYAGEKEFQVLIYGTNTIHILNIVPEWSNELLK